MNQKVNNKKKNKKNKMNNNSSNSLVFGQWPQTKNISLLRGYKARSSHK